MQATKPSIVKLRDAKLADLEALGLSHADPIYKRAHHVITEDVRTLGAVEAFEAGDFTKVRSTGCQQG
jgi:galactokinase